jgi:hypothetical protein
MARVIEITVSPGRTDDLVRKLKEMEGIIGLRVQKGVSLQPEGDLVTAQTTTRFLPNVLSLLNRQQLIGPACSFSTNEPSSLVSENYAAAISSDSSEATWEEMDYSLNRESHMTINGLLVMAISGMVATVGLTTGALHLITGAKLIAPGFAMISRIGWGVVAQSRNWWRGAVDTLIGYASLIAGAMLMTIMLRHMGNPPLGDGGTYLSGRSLVAYWTTVNSTTVICSAFGAIAGAILIAANRVLLTAGIMVIMALVPSAALVGIGLVSGNFVVAGKGLRLWLIEVGLVIAGSLLVFAWKRIAFHRRKSFL